MIPYKDGLSILENHDDADGKLTMTISKGVRLIVLDIYQVSLSRLTDDKLIQ